MGGLLSPLSTPSVAAGALVTLASSGVVVTLGSSGVAVTLASPDSVAAGS